MRLRVKAAKRLRRILGVILPKGMSVDYDGQLHCELIGRSSTAPRLRTSFSPTHHDRLSHVPVALSTGEAGRSSARQAPGPGRGLA
jgi:hypothetical protein